MNLSNFNFFDLLIGRTLNPLLGSITKIVANNQGSNNGPPVYNIDDFELDLRLNALQNITYLSEDTDTASGTDDYFNLLNDICSDRDTDSHNSDQYL